MPLSLRAGITALVVALALQVCAALPAHAAERVSADDQVRNAIAAPAAQPSLRLTRALPDLSTVEFPSTATDDTEAESTDLFRVSPQAYSSNARFVVTAPKKRWRGLLAAYLWASSIKGSVWADGQETDLDAEFTDLFDKLKYAFMGYGEVGYEKWSFAIDASTLKLEDTRGGPLGRADLTASMVQTIIDLRLGYTVWSCNKGGAQWGTCCYPRMMTLDVIAGARYWDLDIDLQVRTRPGVVERSKSMSWWDPYVGARWRYQFSKRWGATAYADIGGFGIGDGSELTWQLQASLRYSITRNFFVALGYRALDVDRVQGGAGAQNGVNATYHGPILGLGYEF